MLDADMVHHENCGQAFMARRFLVSSDNDFREIQDFIPTIGTELYASDASADEKRAVERTARYLKERDNAK